MQLIRCVFLSGVLLVLSSAQAIQTTLPVVTDLSKPIVVSKNNPRFQVVLHANPTTGFSWFMQEYNPQLMSPDSARFIPPSKAVPGRGGLAVWTFHVMPAALRVPTLMHFTLAYARPWSVHDEMLQVVTVVTQ